MRIVDYFGDMRTSGLIAFVLIFVVCCFCKRDFASQAGHNRHAWRCKSKLAHDGHARTISNAVPIQLPAINPVCEAPSCFCGKKCKNLRGLKAHQRSCKNMKSFTQADLLNDVAREKESNPEELIVNQDIDDFLGESAETKQGINLPKSAEEWALANTYFQANLPLPEHNITNLDEAVVSFNDTVYSYFRNNFGTKGIARINDKVLTEKYAGFKKAQLKTQLKHLKINQGSCHEIKFVSKLLRTTLKSKADLVDRDDHDLSIRKNFWSYCKMFIDRTIHIKPSFSKDVCHSYFKKYFSCTNRGKLFRIPEWIKPLHAPEHEFNNSAPSYNEVSKIIEKMKAASSPCPLDQISIICFKRCPFLRSYITRLLQEVWDRKTVPVPWKKAVTILIHKSGENDQPGNFRPITLEPVAMKMLTSLIRNRVLSFLISNRYAESHIQKGFIPKMSGTFEHIENLSFLITQARRQKKSLTVTLIDLQNAFGEVHHNLIDTALRFHNVPDHVCTMIKHLYDQFYTAVATEAFVCDFVRVEKGVLQGDCLSPLLFNMVINTFIQYITIETFSNLGYKFAESFLPRHWLQFADDAVAITSREYENQILLDAFVRWCSWSNLIVRVDKCHSFGMTNKNNSSRQVKPKVFINNHLVHAVEVGESFVYLGRSFDTNMTNSYHKDKVLKTLETLLDIVTALPLHPKNKILIYQRYILPKLSWDLTVANLGVTWVKQTLDNKISSYVRRWCDLPVSATLNIAKLAKSQYGLGLVLASARFAQCQVTYRNCLRKSINPDIRYIHQQTATSNVQFDIYKSSRETIKQLRECTKNKIEKEMTLQKIVVSSIWKYALPRFANAWSRVVESLPRNLFNFCVRYLSNSLPNATNTFRWKTSASSQCNLCQEPETLQHVVSGCKKALVEGRYNWRHDSVLLAIASMLSSRKENIVYCDTKNNHFAKPDVITGNEFRPDLVVLRNKKLLVLEVTTGFEANIANNEIRKKEKYGNLLNELKINYDQVFFVNLSMGTLGIMGKESENLENLLIDFGLSEQEERYLRKKLSNICIRATYYIFCRRGKAWDDTLDFLAY